MNEDDARNGDMGNGSALGHQEPSSNSHPQHGPDAGRLFAAASLDIEAAGLLEKVRIWK